jgi:hypothetical protein
LGSIGWESKAQEFTRAFVLGGGRGKETADWRLLNWGRAESSSSLLERLSMGTSDGSAGDPSGGHGGLLHPVQNVFQTP